LHAGTFVRKLKEPGLAVFQGVVTHAVFAPVIFVGRRNIDLSQCETGAVDECEIGAASDGGARKRC
jgi:hypothetical protein